MPSYRVTVIETVRLSAVVEVAAENAKEAKRKAVYEAGTSILTGTRVIRGPITDLDEEELEWKADDVQEIVTCCQCGARDVDDNMLCCIAARCDNWMCDGCALRVDDEVRCHDCAGKQHIGA